MMFHMTTFYMKGMLVGNNWLKSITQNEHKNYFIFYHLKNHSRRDSIYLFCGYNVMLMYVHRFGDLSTSFCMGLQTLRF